MSPVDDLSPDRRAVLQLLLDQGKSYDELARLLRSDAASVRARAVGALEALAPPNAAVPTDLRAELSDWLLGQQDPAQTARTLERLADSPAARGWVTEASGALREGGFAAHALPDLPEPPPDAPEGVAPRLPGFAADGRQRPPSSRLGGALLLAGIVVVLAAALVWALDSDDDSGATSSTVATAPTATTAAAEPEIVSQVNLRAPGGGEALGIANVLAQGDQRAVAIRGQDLRRNTKGDAYAVWLAGGPGGAATRLGFAPAVGRNGRLEGASALPEDAADYRRLVISRETDADPQKPTTVVLTGRLDLG